MLSTAGLWTALGGDPAGADVEVRGGGRRLRSAFDVDGIAAASVSCMLLAAGELAAARGGSRPALAVDAGHVACAFASERHARRGGAPLDAGFAPLSRFAPTRDGWIRLHANYPHHRRALLAVLEADESHAPAAIARWSAVDLEEAIVEAGGAAAAVRTAAEWAAHPQGRAAARLGLVQRGRVTPSPPRRRLGPPPVGRPAAGLRVLDLTRVIAGPVATRVLAALGADVLRIDPPHMPEDPALLPDMCPGKRLAALDLRGAGAEALDRLLASADAVVHGYRPGALAAFGLGADRLADRHPHLVVGSLSAWGHTGPWAERRGFDSLVQAAGGIAVAEGADGRPGALPVQALDHATGYLLAAAVLRELAARQRGEHAGHVRIALAGTAAELVRHGGAPGPNATHPPSCDRHRVTLRGAGPPVSLIAPPGALDGRRLGWSAPARASAPGW